MADEPQYKLGKLPATPLKKKAIRFGDVFTLARLPTAPKIMNTHSLVKTWGMYGNDEFGCCVWATKANSHQLWSKMGGRARTRFTTFNVLSDYSAATGFMASDPVTDQGTDMKTAAEYHRKIGIMDATGKRRRINSYVNVEPGNLEQIDASIFIFGVCEIGVYISNENMEQFDNEEPWTVKGTPIGGHCIPVVGRDADGYYLCITWGRLQRMTKEFIEKNMDEGITYLNDEILNRSGISTTSAFNRERLDDMLKAVSPQVFSKAPEPQEEYIRYGVMTDSGPYPSPKQFDVAFRELRQLVDSTGYGWMVGNEKLRPAADRLAINVVKAGEDT